VLYDACETIIPCQFARRNAREVCRKCAIVRQNRSNEPRADRIRLFVEQQGRVSVAEVADAFAISSATARRAILALAEAGEIRRVHGGAIAVHRAPPELPIMQRVADQHEAKLRIAKAAATLAGDDETVFLGSGSTTLEVAKALVGRKDLTVLTNSLAVLNVLIDAPDVNVVVLGGELRRSELSLIGSITEAALKEVRASKVIMGIRAIHPEHGLTNDSLPEARTDREILAMGGEVIIVADHTKCGRISAAFVAPVTVMDTLITDDATHSDFVEALEAQQIVIHRV
jgi:DeoR/GlpR family transcriptional regulator of sugar metabolism